MTKTVKEVLRLCRAKKSFLISAHQNPDADAIASCLAMAMWLKKLGKKVYVANDDDVPEWLEFLPKSEWVHKAGAGGRSVEYDAFLVMDCGDISRIGRVQKLLIADGKKRPLVNIDHHITNSCFGDINLVWTKASSTCEIIYELLTAAGCELDKNLSQVLYAGIMTDTGSFRYDNTRARTHAIAAQLMRHGLDAQDMHQRLYVGIPVKDMKLFIEIIYQARLKLNQKVYCVCLTPAMTSAFSKSFDLREKIFGFLRSVRGVEVVVILTQISSSEVRINLRSQGDLDVAALALQFDGGGHRKAAGAKFSGSLAQAERQLLRAIKSQMSSKGQS